MPIAKILVGLTLVSVILLPSISFMRHGKSGDVIRDVENNVKHDHLGKYLGCFRISRGQNDASLMNRTSFISAHPDSGRLFWAVSGRKLANLGKGSGTAGYIGDFKIPDLTNLKVETSLNATVLSDPVENWREVLDDYRSNGDTKGNPSYARIGGIAYARNQKKLFINFARYYHVQGVTIPGIAEFDPITLRRIGPYRVSENRPAKVSDINGSLTALDGVLKGDVMSTVSWGVNNSGPRQSLIEFIESDRLKWSPLIYHTKSHPYKHTSQKIPSGSGVFVGEHFVFPVRNGTGGWYGLPDGYVNRKGKKVFVAKEDNWLPDMIDTNKGYHASPYRAKLFSVPTKQLREVIEGKREPHECVYEVDDITSVMFSYRTDTEGRKQYRCNVDASLVEQDGRFYLLERNADTSQAMESGPVVHVFGG